MAISKKKRSTKCVLINNDGRLSSDSLRWDSLRKRHSLSFERSLLKELLEARATSPQAPGLRPRKRQSVARSVTQVALDQVLNFQRSEDRKRQKRHTTKLNSPKFTAQRCGSSKSWAQTVDQISRANLEQANLRTAISTDCSIRLFENESFQMISKAGTKGSFSKGAHCAGRVSRGWSSQCELLWISYYSIP